MKPIQEQERSKNRHWHPFRKNNKNQFRNLLSRTQRHCNAYWKHDVRSRLTHTGYVRIRHSCRIRRILQADVDLELIFLVEFHEIAIELEVGTKAC